MSDEEAQLEGTLKDAIVAVELAAEAQRDLLEQLHAATGSVLYDMDMKDLETYDDHTG